MIFNQNSAPLWYEGLHAADRKNQEGQEVTASFLQDNRRRILQIRKTCQNSVFSASFLRKSAPGMDKEFRRSIEKLPEYHIPRQIFPNSADLLTLMTPTYKLHCFVTL